MPKKVKLIVSPKEYHQKRFEIAKDILASTISLDILLDTDSKEQESIAYNSVNVADSLLAELGYTFESSKQPDQDETSVRNLSQLLKKDE